MALSVLGITSAVEQLATALGLDSWQIQTGSYNGVAFHTVPSTLKRLGNELLNIDALVGATESLLGVTNNQQDNMKLPYGTNTVSTAISDGMRSKIITHSIPNGADVFEDMGWHGETFSIQGIIWGGSYTQALDNLLNVITNPAAASEDDRYVLVHPILGTIQNVRLLSLQKMHNPKLWRSCQYQFNFMSTQPLSYNTSNVVQGGITLVGAITAILTITSSLATIWGEASALLNAFGSKGNTNSVRQSIQNSQKSVLSTVNTSLVVTKLLVSNLKPAGFNSVPLNNTITTPTNDIPSLYYFNSNMTPTDVNTILTFNNANIESCMTILNQINVNAIYDSITSLIALQSQMNKLSLSLLNGFYGTTKQFIVPYDSNLFDICFLNNLDYFSQSNSILQLNKSVIFSTNYIAKNTPLILPISPNKKIRQ